MTDDPMDGGPWGQPFDTTPDEPVADTDFGVLLDDFLATTESLHWAVGGLAIDGGIVVFAGTPESFKSTAAHNLAMTYSRAWASPWMGLEVGEGPVVYVTNEKAAGSIRERLSKMRGGGVAPTYPFVVAHNLTRMTNDAPPGKKPWSSLVAKVADLHASSGKRVLVILDTLTSCAPIGFDENEGKQVAHVLDWLKQVRDAGATIILVHHFSKAGHTNGDASMGIRGHTSLYGDVDGTVVFTRPKDTDPKGVMKPRPKDGAATRKPFAVTVDTDFRMVVADDITISLFSQSMVVDAVRSGLGREAEIVAKVKESVPDVTQGQVREALKAAVGSGVLSKPRTNAPYSYVGGVADDEVGGSTDDADPMADTDD